MIWNGTNPYDIQKHPMHQKNLIFGVTFVDLTIYRYFEDFELQKYHIDDMTIYALILTIFENYKITSYCLTSKMLIALCLKKYSVS